jgi:glycosyltransferase involved in cell wall biosynthesis
MSRLTLEAMRVVHATPGTELLFSISTTNELYEEFRPFEGMILPVDTFRSAPDAASKVFRIFQARRKLINWLREREVKSVVVLMPHIWTPLMADAIKREGIHYAVVVHDAKPHPGDPTGLLNYWLLKDAKAADTVFTLSEWVRKELASQGTAAVERTKVLFMPDVLFPNAGQSHVRRPRDGGHPLRVLFFGRLLQYKGVKLFADALEILAAERVPIRVSVSGEGKLGGVASRLAKLGAVLTNRWLSDAEIGDMLSRHDLVVLTHTEASQSGVIAAALGAGVPVVTTPVGGLAEQVRSRGAGLVAERVDAIAIADCIRSLALDHNRYNSIRIHSDDNFSVAQFLRKLVAALPGRE